MGLNRSVISLSAMAFMSHLKEVYELSQEDSELGKVLRRALKIIEDGLELYGYWLVSYTFKTV
jgi:hypothetical protein